MIYLASPYSHPDWFIMEQRYLNAAKACQHLLNKQQWVYSPIVHCHELAKMATLPKDFLFWQQYNFAMIRSCSRFMILRIDGWEQSAGVAEEKAYALTLSRVVEYL